jgi:hypothetical protein
MIEEVVERLPRAIRPVEKEPLVSFSSGEVRPEGSLFRPTCSPLGCTALLDFVDEECVILVHNPRRPDADHEVAFVVVFRLAESCHPSRSQRFRLRLKRRSLLGFPEPRGQARGLNQCSIRKRVDIENREMQIHATNDQPGLGRLADLLVSFPPV